MFVSPRIRHPFGGINALKTEHLFINAFYNMVVIPERFGIQTFSLFKEDTLQIIAEVKAFQKTKV